MRSGGTIEADGEIIQPGSREGKAARVNDIATGIDRVGGINKRINRTVDAAARGLLGIDLETPVTVGVGNVVVHVDHVFHLTEHGRHVAGHLAQRPKANKDTHHLAQQQNAARGAQGPEDAP